MAEPYPDGRHDGQPRTPPGPMLPMGLLATLLLVVVLAASRGTDAPPPLAGDDRPAATEAPAVGASPGNTDNGDDLDDGAEVLGSVVTPTPAPAATPALRVEDLPVVGSGVLSYAARASTTIGASPHRRFAVAVETDTGLDVEEVAAFVDEVLRDPRSWIGDGVTGFSQVGRDEPVDFTLVVATPATVDRLCAPLQTQGRYSCGANGWIALNLHRWMTATEDWPASLEVYRRYLVNHEFGHYILGGDHDTCPEAGALAPIMMQQTIDLAGCRPNGWVFPRRS